MVNQGKKYGFMLWFPPYSYYNDVGLLEQSVIRNITIGDDVLPVILPLQYLLRGFQVLSLKLLRNISPDLMMLVITRPMSSQNIMLMGVPAPIVAGLLPLIPSSGSGINAQQDHLMGIAYLCYKELNIPLYPISMAADDAVISPIKQLDLSPIMQVNNYFTEDNVITYERNSKHDFSSKFKTFLIEKGVLLGHVNNDSIASATKSIPYVTETLARISLDNIGVGNGVSQDFVNELARAFIREGKEFTIWIDAGREVRLENIDFHKQIDKLQQKDVCLNYNEYCVAWPEVILINEDKGIEKVIKVGSAYHLYLEYEGNVYDNFKAINGDVTLEDYQGNLDSSWRKSYFVSANTIHLEVLSNLSSLIQEAKYRVKT